MSGDDLRRALDPFDAMLAWAGMFRSSMPRLRPIRELPREERRPKPKRPFKGSKAAKRAARRVK